MGEAWVGIGLDAQYTEQYPERMPGLCRLLRARLSHVSIVSLRDSEHARWFIDECAEELPVIHHLSGVAPADPNGPDLQRYAVLDSISRSLGARWSCEDIAIWSLGPFALPYFTPPLLSREAVEHTAAGVRELLRRGSVPFLAEVPSFTVAAGELDLGEYFTALSEESGCGLVADVSHVYSYALVSGRKPIDVLHGLPLDRVQELHVAGGRIESAQPRRYVDSHSDPIMAPVFELVGEAARCCPNLRAVTYEIGMSLSLAQIEADLDNVTRVLQAQGWQPKLDQDVSESA